MMTHSNDWNSPAHQPKLELNNIDVWRVSLRSVSTSAKNLFGLLANDEIDRARRFHFQRDRDRFVVVRGVLRILLSAYIPISPEQIRFQYSARGRPFLALDQNDVMLEFNVSHSHEMALLAFTRGPAVGIDVEYVHPDIVHEQVAERFFSAQEIASLRDLPDSLQAAAFFNCWTRKEAFIKATGEGLSRPLDQFSMSLIPDEAARLLTIQGQPEEASRWFVQDLEPGIGYAAALVAQNPVKQIHRWEYLLFDDPQPVEYQQV
ncbi:MAG: 4'-phosphopantetheinyl transferase superfamily protein [Chloroflexi bacterium]|nr:MAG: 4'-phosphopantetheinyl transferase superfamily protein [Chloroflexota bacterium]